MFIDLMLEGSLISVTVVALGVKKFDFSEEVELLGRPDSEHTLPGWAVQIARAYPPEGSTTRWQSCESGPLIHAASALTL